MCSEHFQASAANRGGLRDRSGGRQADVVGRADRFADVDRIRGKRDATRGDTVGPVSRANGDAAGVGVTDTAVVLAASVPTWLLAFVSV